MFCFHTKMFQTRESYFKSFLASLPLLKSISMKVTNWKKKRQVVVRLFSKISCKSCLNILDHLLCRIKKSLHWWLFQHSNKSIKTRVLIPHAKFDSSWLQICKENHPSTLEISEGDCSSYSFRSNIRETEEKLLVWRLWKNRLN